MKKTWLKLLCLVIAVAMIGSIFVGCGSKKEDPAPTVNDDKQASEQPAEKVKIEWWTHQRHDMEYLKEMVAKFMEENPNIEINYNIQTENYPQNLELAFQSGQAPDIFSLRYNAKYYVDRKMIEPLDDYITEDMRQRFGKFLKVDIENYVGGKIYSLPNSGVNFRLVYNKDLFKKVGLTEPPKTIDEMVEYAQKITEVGKAEGAYGYAMNLKSPYSSMFRSLDQIGYLSGISVYDYKEGKYNFEPIKPIVLAYKEMYEKGYMFPGVEGLDIDPLRSQFAEGKIGMYISGNWEIGVYADQFPAKCDWGAAPVPTVDGVKGTSEIQKAGRWQGISSKSKNKEAAWKVMEWFHRDEVLIPYHEKGLGFSVVPSVLKAAKSPEAKGSEDFKLVDGIDGIWPASPHNQGLNIEGKKMHDIYAAVMLGAMDIDEAIADLNKRYNEALEKESKEGNVERKVIPDFDPSKL